MEWTDLAWDGENEGLSWIRVR